MLAGDILLEIFDFYLDEDVDENIGQASSEKQRIEEWITLAHVCRRWRNVVFQSPLRLNLRLLCTHKSRARDILDIWPAPLPLIIHKIDNNFDDESSNVDNIIAALEHNDRVCKIQLCWFSSSQFGYAKDSAAMQKPFPELIDLQLGPYIHDGPVSKSTEPILPDSFLGGTAPHLRLLEFDGVQFPGLPKLLLSATHLVVLALYNISPSGYVTPEVMTTSLSALTSLESLFLHFRYPRPRPAPAGRRLLPTPLSRSILPSLTKIRFKGVSEYLEEILSRIDAPRLDELKIIFFNQIIFDLPQLFQLISRRPTLSAPEKALVAFKYEAVIVKFPSQTSGYDVFTVKIRCTVPEWQLSSLEQVCTSFLPPVSTLEDLYIFEAREDPPRWQGDVENTLWLDLLRSFAAVKNLYISKEFVPRISPALRELVEGSSTTTDVLLTLEKIFLEGFQTSEPLHEGIEKFVDARRLAGHPVALSRWDKGRLVITTVL